MKNWCVNPFYRKNPRYKSDFPCGWLQNPEHSDYSNEKLRNDFENNKKSKYCKHCWDSESNGVPSKRQQDNQLLSWHSNKTLESLYNERHLGVTRVLQLTSSNLCTLACKTCGPHDSTRWYTEHNNSDELQYNHWSINDSNELQYNHRGKYIGQYKGTLEFNMNRISNADLSNLDLLEILGGEPFIDNNHLSLLERLIDLNKTDISLSYTTNCQQMPFPKLMILLKQFKKVNISLSIDGIGRVFEYMRYPGKWITTLKIIEKLKEVPNFQLNVYNTISNMNVYYFDEIIDWNLKNWSMTDWTYQTVREPFEMAPNVLPDKLKKRIENKFTKSKYAKLLQPILNEVLTPCNQSLYQSFQSRITKQDTFRKIDPKNFIPEIANELY